MHPVCDFCDSSDVLWSYPARDFVLGGTPLASAGGWAACHECAELIESGNAEGLARHAVANLPPEMRATALQVVREVHVRFFQTRRGAPVRACAEAA